MITLLHGVDVVSTGRIEAVCRRHAAFLEEVFTPEEREYCLAQAHPFDHLAARFAAKEATLKALGVGLPALGGAGRLACIGVARLPSGEPALRLTGWVAAQAAHRQIRQSVVSISHAAGVATASVIFLAETPEGPA
jgi:holo-[acyl-carrier protein] synthase